MQIKKIAAVMLVVLAVAVLLPLTVLAMSGVADDKPSSSEVLGPNLLTNPGMEGKYVKQCSLRDGPHWVQVPCPEDYNAEAGTYIQWETSQVPHGWSAWWRQPNNNFDDPDYFNLASKLLDVGVPVP